MLRYGPIILSLSLLLGFAIAIWGFAPSPLKHKKSTTPLVQTDQQYPVLAELFTSQGCSSCPPADQVLQRLTEEAEQGELPVITLSYHVDYWNRLGWKDPYSQAAFSERQRAYANHINDRGVYTPQLVINGRSGHVGSREREVRAAVVEASQRAPQIDLQHDVQWSENGSALVVNYQLSALPEDAVLQIAIIEKHTENNVPRGENRGRHLAHTNVVRQLVSIVDLQKTGQALVELQDALKSDKALELDVVLFLQDKHSMEILGIEIKS